MSDFLADLHDLRTKLREASAKGIFEENGASVFENVIIQLVNEAEQKRQALLNKAEQFEKQAAQFHGQAQGFNSFKSMAYGIIDGMIKVKERADAEEAARLKEREENSQQMQDALEQFEKVKQNK